MSIQLFYSKIWLNTRKFAAQESLRALKIVQNPEYKYLIRPNNYLHLEFCAETGKQPEKPFKGSFNVRSR